MQLKIRQPKYPLNQYIADLESLVELVGQRQFEFEEELAEIHGFEYRLDAHPEDAIAEFNELYALVQGYRSRVVSILISVHRERAEWIRFKNRANALYRRAKDTLLSTRSDIKELRNKELQEAKVHEEIPELVNIREYIINTLEEIDLVVDMAEEKKEDLDSAGTTLSRQQKIMESLIGTGYEVRANRMKGKSVS